MGLPDAGTVFEWFATYLVHDAETCSHHKGLPNKVATNDFRTLHNAKLVHVI